jgi:hypothetical protein
MPLMKKNSKRKRKVSILKKQSMLMQINLKMEKIQINKNKLMQSFKKLERKIDKRLKRMVK